MVRNNIEIDKAIKKSEDLYCMDDSEFSIVEILEIVLPEGSKVDQPVMSFHVREDLIDCNEWIDDVHGRFDINSEGSMGFRIKLPITHTVDDDDGELCVLWIIETLKRFLDLQGRYSSNNYGPKSLDYLGAPSLTFDASHFENEIKIEYWLDDSTR